MSINILLNSSTQIKYCLFDNDALSEAYNNPNLLKSIQENFPNVYFIVLPSIVEEFYEEARGKGLEALDLKHTFLTQNKDFFNQIATTKEMQKQIISNGNEIKRLYIGLMLNGKARYTDLHLQSNAIILGESSCILTGNLNDFSHRLFSIVSIFEIQPDLGKKERRILYFLQPRLEQIPLLINDYAQQLEKVREK